MKTRYNTNKLLTNKAGKKIFSIILCLCIALNVLTVFNGINIGPIHWDGIAQTANATPTDWPSILNSHDVDEFSGWKPTTPCTDELGDMPGGGSAALDIVGNETFPSAYIHFGNTGEEIAVRIRVNGHDGNTLLEFKKFAYIGIDITGNGTIDLFLGAYNPTGNNGRLGIYLADPALANTGPGNTGLTKPIASFQPRAGFNYAFIPTGHGINGFDGDEDYFISFMFTLEDINNALTTVGRENLKLTPEQPFTYIIGTSTQDNSLNGDFNGIIGMGNNGHWPLPPPISTDGAKYFTVTFDKTIGDLDASPKMISVKNNGYVSDPPSDPKKRVTIDDEGVDWFWEFVGWTTSDDSFYHVLSGIQTITDQFYTTITSITGDMTVYAVWRNSTTQQLADEAIVHFDPSGGSWVTAPTGYKDIQSVDGIIRNMPVDPNPPTSPSPSGQNKYVFGGWVTDYRGYITTGNSQWVNTRNIIDLSGTSPGTVDFFVWSQLVTDLDLVYQSHSGEMERTVYALWLIVPTQSSQVRPVIAFYDNIYEGTPPPYGALLYYVYGNSANQAKVTYSPPPPTRQGYSFQGWDTLPDGTGTRYENEQGVNTPVTTITFSTNMDLYAIWVPNDYALLLDVNNIDMDGSNLVYNIPPVLTFYEKLCDDNTEGIIYPTLPISPSLDGYLFRGWNTDPQGYGIWAGGPGNIIFPGDLIRFSLLETADLPMTVENKLISGYTRLYAVWERQVITTIFDVIFHATGGEFHGDYAPGGISMGTDEHNWYIISIETHNGQIDGGAYISASPPTWPINPMNPDAPPEYVFVGWSLYSPYNSQQCTVDFFHPAATSVVFFEATDIYAVWQKVPDIYPTVTFWPNTGSWPGTWHPGGNVYGSIEIDTDNYGLVLYVPYSNNPIGPEKIGFNFTGWNAKVDGTGDVFTPDMEVTADMVDDSGTLNVYAQWRSIDPDYVVVTFLLNDGTTGDSAVYSGPSLVLKDGEISDPGNLPENAGWHFIGWYTDETCTGMKWDFQTDTVDAESTCLYAKWEVDVTFDLNDGANTIYKTDSVQRTHTVTKPISDPEWSGRVFGGWYKDMGCMDIWNFYDPVDEPMTLYAKWVNSADLYWVKYDPNGVGDWTLVDETYSPLAYGVATPVFGTNSSIVGSPSKTGYTFLGWNGTWAPGVSPTVIENVTYVAQWSVDPTYPIYPVYNIIYNPNNGSGSMLSETVTYGDYFKLSKNLFSRTDYAFVCWNTASDGSGSFYIDEYAFSSWSLNYDLVLYAQWVQVSSSIIVTFDKNTLNAVTGPTPASKGVTFGASYGDLATITCPGYTFDGWFLNAECTGNAVTSDTIVAISSSHVLYAKWISNNANTSVTYVVHYYLRGTSNSVTPDKTVSGWFIGELITENAISLSGYTAVNPVSITKTLEASVNEFIFYYTQNPYAITIEDGGRGSSGQGFYISGTMVTVNAGDKEGYTFKGWSVVSDGVTIASSSSVLFTFTMPTTDAIVVANWEQDPVTASYDVTVNNSYADTIGEGSYTPGTVVTIDAGTREGYTFKGWTVTSGGVVLVDSNDVSITFTMPADDVVIAANWVANTSSWALVNLMLCVIGVVLVVFVLLLKRRQDEQEMGQSAAESQKSRRRSMFWLLLVAVLAIVGVVVFLFTEDLGLSFGWVVNKWTIVNAAILVAECITVWLCLRAVKKVENQQ
jgi:uncharacterized repeat protein (TIGR02543 family)